MPEHPNIELVRRGYEAFASGDMAWMNENLAEDVVWHTPGNNPGSGEFAGRDAVIGSFGRLFGATGGTFKLAVHDVVGNDQHVVGLATFSAQGPDGEAFESRGVNVFHVENGKAKEVWLYNEDTTVADAFFNKLAWPSA
jgi:ketosteroid isomerase-like protein